MTGREKTTASADAAPWSSLQRKTSKQIAIDHGLINVELSDTISAKLRKDRRRLAALLTRLRTLARAALHDARDRLEATEMAMAEMIIPGTYVDVRAEGLISARGVSTGILGVIGTARSGPIGVAQTLSSLSNARDIFGRADDYAVPDDGSNPLTLTRALQLAYNNGASSVVAVRVASPRRASASYALKDGTGNTGREADRGHARAAGATTSRSRWTSPRRRRGSSARSTPPTFAALNYKAVVPNPQNRIQVTRGDTRRVDIFNLVYKLVVRRRDGAEEQRRHLPARQSQGGAGRLDQFRPGARRERQDGARLRRQSADRRDRRNHYLQCGEHRPR